MDVVTNLSISLQVFDFDLTQDELKQMDELDEGTCAQTFKMGFPG
jgi:diketogulonate reductase-like aldo/keto reductase